MEIPLHRVKNNGKVDIWDLGPQVAPKPPAAPDEPDARLKGGELAAAQVAYEDACEAYKDQLRDYNERRKAHRAWHEEKGGPVKQEFWGVDATFAMEREPERYKLDLPRGTKPGAAQLAAEERAEVEIEELKRARALDPQFGQQRAV